MIADFHKTVLEAFGLTPQGFEVSKKQIEVNCPGLLVLDETLEILEHEGYISKVETDKWVLTDLGLDEL